MNKKLIPFVLIYIILFFILNVNLYTSKFSFLVLLIAGSLAFYNATDGIIKRKTMLRGFKFEGISAVVFGILGIAFSLFILLAAQIFR